MDIKELTLEDLIAEIISRIEHDGKLKRSEAVKALIGKLLDEYGGTV